MGPFLFSRYNAQTMFSVLPRACLYAMSSSWLNPMYGVALLEFFGSDDSRLPRMNSKLQEKGADYAESEIKNQKPICCSLVERVRYAVALASRLRPATASTYRRL